MPCTNVGGKQKVYPKTVRLNPLFGAANKVLEKRDTVAFVNLRESIQQLPVAATVAGPSSPALRDQQWDNSLYRKWAEQGDGAEAIKEIKERLQSVRESQLWEIRYGVRMRNRVK